MENEEEDCGRGDIEEDERTEPAVEPDNLPSRGNRRSSEMSPKALAAIARPTEYSYDFS